MFRAVLKNCLFLSARQRQVFLDTLLLTFIARLNQDLQLPNLTQVHYDCRSIESSFFVCRSVFVAETAGSTSNFTKLISNRCFWVDCFLQKNHCLHFRESGRSFFFKSLDQSNLQVLRVVPVTRR